MVALCHLDIFRGVLTSRRAGTLAVFAQYGAGNPRDFVSGRFTSLVNCGELVNTPYSLGELDVST